MRAPIIATTSVSAVLLAVCAALGQLLVSGEEVSQALVVRDVNEQPGGTLTGVLVNKSEEPISNVRLLIRHTFLWARERKPKEPEENPSRAVFYDLDVTVPASGAIPFLYRPEPPLADRSDGRFESFVEVVSFHAVGGWALDGVEDRIED